MPVGNADEATQIDARPSIGSKPHHFPFILESLKTEPPRELGIKQADRIRPPNHLDKFEFAPFAVPDRGRLPGTPSVDHNHSRLVEPGNRVRAQGVSIMVLDSLETVFRWPNISAKKALAIPLILLNSTDALCPQNPPPSHPVGARKEVAH